MSEPKPNETNPKKMVSRSVAITLGIVCILLIAGLGGAIAYYTMTINNKDNQIKSANSTISSLNSEVSIQNSTISSLGSQISQLNATIASLEAQIPHTVTVQIYASDPNDGFPRTWDVVFDRAMPPLADGGDHVGSDVDQDHYSGDTMTFTWSLGGGAHYLIFDVTQTGGPSYGTYSGTITINGNTHNFSGVDANNTVTINFTVS